ncbi:MAG TPA: RDD family protein [Chitinophagaceae bacterium]
MEENVQPVEQRGIFDNFAEHVDASVGARFLNFLIDNLLMRFVLSYATAYLMGIILAAVAPDFIEKLTYSEGDGFSGTLFFFTLIVGYLNYILYYTVCETAFKGYTLGKLVTGTRAIREDGLPLTFRDALLRTLSRLVPFEPLSAFGGNPWHDTWTKTRVIKSR